MSEHGRAGGDAPIVLPAPTAWPLLLAFGLALGFGGLVTHALVSLVGGVLVLVSAVGWWHEVLPVEHEIEIELPMGVAPRLPAVRARVDRLRPGEGGHRMRLPVEVHPFSAGLWAGVVGGVAMALVATLFGFVSHTSLWYPVNLLAAGAVPSLAEADQATLEAFSGLGLVVGGLVHVALSLFVGLLYAALLPIFPRHPALVGGVVAPLLWSVLVWAVLGIVNPALSGRIDWSWFVASQLAFGFTAGFVVQRSEKIATMQTWSLAARAGIETGGDDAGGAGA